MSYLLKRKVQNYRKNENMVQQTTNSLYYYLCMIYLTVHFFRSIRFSISKKNMKRCYFCETFHLMIRVTCYSVTNWYMDRYTCSIYETFHWDFYKKSEANGLEFHKNIEERSWTYDCINIVTTTPHPKD